MSKSNLTDRCIDVQRALGVSVTGEIDEDTRKVFGKLEMDRKIELERFAREEASMREPTLAIGNLLAAMEASGTILISMPTVGSESAGQYRGPGIGGSEEVGIGSPS